MSEKQPGNDQQYLLWLCRKAGLRVRNYRDRATYRNLARVLQNEKYGWFVPNDDNRLKDGMSLREEYCDYMGEWNETWISHSPCTMLEFLVALSERIWYEADDCDHPSIWFHRLLENIDLLRCNDQVWEIDHKGELEYVRSVVDRINYRTYSPNGEGGLFPLKHTDQDQRKVEVWYQMSAYLLENLPYFD